MSTQRVGNDEIGYVHLVVKPSQQTPPSVAPQRVEILSRAEIARRRMADEAARKAPVIAPAEPPKRKGWPKGKSRKK